RRHLRPPEGVRDAEGDGLHESLPLGRRADGGVDPGAGRVRPRHRDLRAALCGRALRDHAPDGDRAAALESGARADARHVVGIRDDRDAEAPRRGSGGRVLMPADALITVDGVSHYYGTGQLRKQILYAVSAIITAGEI